MVKSVAIIGGETHLSEVSGLQGKTVSIVATCMKEEDLMAVGTEGCADMDWWPPSLRLTNGHGADVEIEGLPERASVVKDWLDGGDVVPQETSLRANRLAVRAAESAEGRCRIEVG